MSVMDGPPGFHCPTGPKAATSLVDVNTRAAAILITASIVYKLAGPMSGLRRHLPSRPRSVLFPDPDGPITTSSSTVRSGAALHTEWIRERATAPMGQQHQCESAPMSTSSPMQTAMVSQVTPSQPAAAAVLRVRDLPGPLAVLDPHGISLPRRRAPRLGPRLAGRCLERQAD